MYQKLKKSSTSLSEVAGEMPDTWTVEGLDIVMMELINYEVRKL